jgi:excisionase family DNA binding protein
MNARPEPLRVGEAARRLRITSRELLDLIDAGDVEAVKVDGLLRVSPSAVDSRLARQAPPSA